MIMGTAKLYEDEKACFWSLTNRIRRLPSKSSQATDTLCILSVRPSPSFSFSYEWVRRPETPVSLSWSLETMRHGSPIDITQRGGKFHEGSHSSKKQNGYISKTSIPGCALTMLLFQLKRIRSCQGRLTMSFIIFMPNIWVGWTTLNREKMGWPDGQNHWGIL